MTLICVVKPRSRAQFVLATLSSALVLGACATSQSGSAGTGALSSDSVRTLLRHLRASTAAPSISVAISRDGRMILGTGVSAGGAAGPETMYRIGSLSKMLTVAALARLAEQGRIDLDTDVRRYVPEFPAKRYSITLRHLAGHVAGIRHYGAGEFINITHYESLGAALAIFAKDSLLFEPGTRYFYSTYGYNLIGLAMERAAEVPFLQLVHNEVLAPLGLQQMAPDRPDSSIANRAPLLGIDSTGAAIPASRDDLSDRWPAGGFLSSVTDLARFGSAFVTPGFLADSTIRAMTTSQRLRSGAATGVGLGWRVGTDSGGRTIWHHAGASNGGRSLLVIWPAEKLVVAIAANAFIDLSAGTAFRFADAVRAPTRR